LAELGVGNAMVFSMYKPIAEDNSTEICALMNLYKMYYRIIGVIVLVVGIIVCPFLTYLIKGNVPSNLNIYVLYILNLMATVFSYWLFAYKNSILQAHQRQDVISKVTIVVNTIMYILQIVGICVFRNYYTYVILLLLGQIFVNIFTAYKSNKLYPQYKAKGKLGKVEIRKINQRVKDLFTAKIGGIIVNSADSIVISAFLGLTTLAIYENYYFIVKSIIAMLAVVFSSCTAGIGNSLIVESNEKNYNDLKKFTFIIAWITGFCSISLLCVIQNFIELWVGPDLLIAISNVLCLIVYFWVNEINSVLLLYKDAGGIWHSDRLRPLITALTNLLLNIILVQYIGLYGVILSTVLSTVLIGFPWLINNLFKYIFKMKSTEYLIKIFQYLIITIIAAGITYFVCSFVSGTLILKLTIKAIICMIIPNLIFLVVFRKNKEFGEVIELADKIKNKILKKS
jgi:O-antigen/teichoic acid export membrane protein